MSDCGSRIWYCWGPQTLLQSCHIKIYAGLLGLHCNIKVLHVGPGILGFRDQGVWTVTGLKVW